MRHFILAGLAAIASQTPALTPQQEAIRPFGPICGEAPIFADARDHKLLMLPNMGNDHMQADTSNLEAQKWFDYGLSLTRSFQHEDAALAFAKAQGLDPTCSMCVWGEAYARGPTINYGNEPDDHALVKYLAHKAQDLAGPRTTPTMRALEAGLVARFDAPIPAEDEADAKANVVWSDAMDALHKASPEDVELAIFDADAWLMRATDKDKTLKAPREAVKILKPLIAAHAESTGLIHYYIHATEYADDAEAALPYVKHMGELAAGASHMVHMPSHTYLRAGLYEAAGKANLDALLVDEAYARTTGTRKALGALAYHSHDFEFGLVGAMLAGDKATALRLVGMLHRDYPTQSDAEKSHYVAADALIAFAEFAAPEAALKATETAQPTPMLEAMRHYARGRALLRQGRPSAVWGEAEWIRLASDGPSPPSKTAQAVVKIARLSLQGDAALAEHETGAAITLYRAAAEVQEAEFSESFDPPIWWFPVRRNLAAALVASGDPAAAVKETQKVLKTWKQEPLTLSVQARAEDLIGDKAAALADRAKAAKGWLGDSQTLRSE